MKVRLNNNLIDFNTLIDDLSDILTCSEFNIIIEHQKKKWLQIFKEDGFVSIAYRNNEITKYKNRIDNWKIEQYSALINQYVEKKRVQLKWDRKNPEKQISKNRILTAPYSLVAILILIDIVVFISAKKGQSGLLGFLHNNLKLVFSIFMILLGMWGISHFIALKHTKSEINSREKVLAFFGGPLFILTGIFMLFHTLS